MENYQNGGIINYIGCLLGGRNIVGKSEVTTNAKA